MIWTQLASIVDQLNISIRIILIDKTVTEWSEWLNFPTQGYGKVRWYGPFRLVDVDYVEINSMESFKPGKLLPWKEIDHSEELEKEMKNAGIDYKKVSKNLFLIKLGNEEKENKQTDRTKLD